MFRDQIIKMLIKSKEEYTCHRLHVDLKKVSMPEIKRVMEFSEFRNYFFNIRNLLMNARQNGMYFNETTSLTTINKLMLAR